MLSNILDYAISQLQQPVFPIERQLFLTLLGQLVIDPGFPPEKFDHPNNIHR